MYLTFHKNNFCYFDFVSIKFDSFKTFDKLVAKLRFNSTNRQMRIEALFFFRKTKLIQLLFNFAMNVI